MDLTPKALFGDNVHPELLYAFTVAYLDKLREIIKEAEEDNKKKCDPEMDAELETLSLMKVKLEDKVRWYEEMTGRA